MYRPITTQAGVGSDDAAIALVKPDGIGDKMPVYLLIEGGAAAVDLAAAGAEAGMGLTVGAGEIWMAGPILGMDIAEWGLFSASAAADHNVSYVAGRIEVDTRPNPRSVHDRAPTAIMMDFVWRQLV